MNLWARIVTNPPEEAFHGENPSPRSPGSQRVRPIAHVVHSKNPNVVEAREPIYVKDGSIVLYWQTTLGSGSEGEV